MPQSCVNLLKENGNWDLPYKFEHPSDMQIAHGPLPINYTKLELNGSSGHLVEDTERELLQEQDEEECQQASKDNNLVDDLNDQADEDFGDEQVATSRQDKWMISKLEQGKLSILAKQLNFCYQESILQGAAKKDTGLQNFFLARSPLILSTTSLYLEMLLSKESVEGLTPI